MIAKKLSIHELNSPWIPDFFRYFTWIISESLRKHVLWSDNEKLKRWSDNTQSLLLPPDAFNTYMDLWDRPGWPKNHIFDHVDWKDWALRTSIHYSWIPWILAEMSIHTHEYQSPLTIHTHDKATKCMSWIIHSNHESWRGLIGSHRPLCGTTDGQEQNTPHS